MATVLTTSRAFATCYKAQEVLKNAGLDINIITPSKPLQSDELVKLVNNVDAIIAGLDFIDDKVIKAASPMLKIIARNGVGYDRVDLKSASENNVYVTITPGTNSISVCELAFSLMTGLSRKVHLMDSYVREGSWKREPGIELFGKTIGILGTGAIGKNLALRCLAFGMNVIAYDLYPDKELIEKYHVKYVNDPQEIYQVADFISLHLPAVKQTHHMINKQSIDLMKKDVFIINTSRGELIDDDALYEALVTNRIKGAGLDVFTMEPFTDQRFFKLNNVILTPHSGAFTQEATEKTLIMAAKEVVRVLSGENPLHPVN